MLVTPTRRSLELASANAAPAVARPPARKTSAARVTVENRTPGRTANAMTVTIASAPLWRTRGVRQAASIQRLARNVPGRYASEVAPRTAAVVAAVAP